MGEIHFDARSARVTAATLDLYHLYSMRPGWDLEVELAGPIPQLSITGTGARPALPGPSPIEVAYLDQPATVTVDGVLGALALVRSELTLAEIGQGKVRLRGTLHATWTPRSGAPRNYPIELDLEAALVT